MGAGPIVDEVIFHARAVRLLYERAVRDHRTERVAHHDARIVARDNGQPIVDAVAEIRHRGHGGDHVDRAIEERVVGSLLQRVEHLIGRHLDQRVGHPARAVSKASASADSGFRRNRSP
jgi:hypothetical protein